MYILFLFDMLVTIQNIIHIIRYLGKHLVQAVPFVYALQCLIGKVDNNNTSIDMYVS